MQRLEEPMAGHGRDQERQLRLLRCMGRGPRRGKPGSGQDPARHSGGQGLVLPGMPLGSPGMETPNGTVQPYTVELVGPDGQVVAFAEH